MAFHGVAALVGGLIILISVRQISFTNMFQRGMDQTVPESRIRLLRELISINDHYWMAHYELGNTYAVLDNQIEAERHFNRALEVRPHDVELLDKLGVALARIKGRDAESEDCFKRATEIAPYYYRPWYNWAVVSARKSDWAQSLSSLNRSLSFRSDHIPSRSLRARVQYERKEFSSALADLRILKSRSPSELDWFRQNSPALANEPAFGEIFSRNK
jgi:Tfp pilus assembly protein PilF